VVWFGPWRRQRQLQLWLKVESQEAAWMSIEQTLARRSEYRGKQEPGLEAAQDPNGI
jgi:hypothetical protein